jgi:hypothetical protein
MLMAMRLRTPRPDAENTDPEMALARIGHLELASRISTAPIYPTMLLADAMVSLQTLHNVLEEQLLTVGLSRAPVEPAQTAGELVLTAVRTIQAFLTWWSPSLHAWETNGPPGPDPALPQPEYSWPTRGECIADLAEMQGPLDAISMSWQISRRPHLCGHCRQRRTTNQNVRAMWARLTPLPASNAPYRPQCRATVNISSSAFAVCSYGVSIRLPGPPESRPRTVDRPGRRRAVHPDRRVLIDAHTHGLRRRCCHTGEPGPVVRRWGSAAT